MADAAECPFCGFTPSKGDYQLLLHIEKDHPDEGGSPFVADHSSDDDSSSDDGSVPEASTAATEPPKDAAAVNSPPREGKHRASSVTKRPRDRRKHDGQKAGVVAAWKGLFNGKKPPKKLSGRKRGARTVRAEEERKEVVVVDGQLGKLQLGRYAGEKEMPSWLVTLLEAKGETKNGGVIIALEELLARNQDTKVSYLCHPHVQHVSKQRREGSFCGYRNIQMLISHLIHAKAFRSDIFGETYPTIFQLQDLIEQAWDMGFNAHGRVETGGIKGTRKYIGTPEAQALFNSLGVPCAVSAFKNSQGRKGRDLLFDAVERYFESDPGERHGRVHPTLRPPIYFQHAGHSMTIIGFERLTDDETHILVFDPSRGDSSGMLRLIDGAVEPKTSAVDRLIEPYRRSKRDFRRYDEFEILYLTTARSAT